MQNQSIAIGTITLSDGSTRVLTTDDSFVDVLNGDVVQFEFAPIIKADSNSTNVN